MHITDSHQRRNIRLVWLGGQRIAKEQHGFGFALGHATADDQVAAFGSVSYSFNIQAEFIVEQLAGVARGDQFMAAEELDVPASEFEQLGSRSEGNGHLKRVKIYRQAPQAEA